LVTNDPDRDIERMLEEWIEEVSEMTSPPVVAPESPTPSAGAAEPEDARLRPLTHDEDAVLRYIREKQASGISFAIIEHRFGRRQVREVTFNLPIR
jgi:hypothetical protein